MRSRFSSVASDAPPHRKTVERAENSGNRTQNRELLEKLVSMWRAASTRFGGLTGEQNEPVEVTADSEPALESPEQTFETAHQMVAPDEDAHALPTSQQAPPPRTARTVNWEALREKAGTSAN